ncbi:MAG: hypothetical protein AABZ67_06640, partial [Pseudomonadota bacterium]
NVHRILMLAQQSERRLSAAVEEISQVVTAEMNALFDQGLFNLPPTNAPQLVMAASQPRRAAPAKRRRAGSSAMI